MPYAVPDVFYAAVMMQCTDDPAFAGNKSRVQEANHKRLIRARNIDGSAVQYWSAPDFMAVFGNQPRPAH
jgi:hypothetical protein